MIETFYTQSRYLHLYSMATFISRARSSAGGERDVLANRRPRMAEARKALVLQDYIRHARR